MTMPAIQFNNDIDTDFIGDTMAAVKSLSGETQEDTRPVETSVDIGTEAAEQLNKQDDLRQGKEAQRRDPNTGRFASKAEKVNNDHTDDVREAVAKLQGQPEQQEQQQPINAVPPDIESVIAPRREYYQRFGFKSDGEAINHLFSLSDFVERDPEAGIVHIAKHSGVDPKRLIAAIAQSAGLQQTPNLSSQQDVVNQAAEKVQMQAAEQLVKQYERNAPEHYWKVKPIMKSLLESDQAYSLEEAYDKALWVHADTRKALLEAERGKVAGAQRQQAKVRAASASLSGPPHGTPSTPTRRNSGNGQFGDVAEDVRAAVASLS